MKVENIYTSIACNRSPGCLDINGADEVIFGANHAVAVFDLKYAPKIRKTLVAHKNRVQCLKWIDTKRQFISGSDDKTAIFWDITDESNVKKQLLQGHDGGVNVVEGRYFNGQLLLATASTDSTIKLWKYSDGAGIFECFQTITLEKGYCFSIKLTTLPKSTQILLIFSGNGEALNIWSQTDSDGQFTKVHTLLGHEDWIRSIDVTEENGELLILSGAQDHYVRVWKISPRTLEQVKNNRMDVLNLPAGDIQMEETIISVKNTETIAEEYFAVNVESVLAGHEGWIYSVQWFKNECGALGIMTASIDKSIILWYQSEDGLWMDTHRVGEMGGGGLGFLGAKMGASGKSLLAHGFLGSLHYWSVKKEEGDDYTLQPEVAVSGHFGDVRDIGWEPKGAFLYSISSDQTSRIHAPWMRDDGVVGTWNEIARPQIHGYDMQSLAVVSRYKFVSGAEEKVIRMFNTTENFIRNVRRISKIKDDDEGDQLILTLPKGASVPSLGLSNKAVFNVSEYNAGAVTKQDEFPEYNFMQVEVTHPPFEEDLLQNTLWPEVHKLYGHGFEIYSLASTPNEKYLASACRATTAEHAEILIWDLDTTKQLQQLPGHNLTVTDLKFSPDSHYLVSVSRDRTWCLFENQSTDNSANFQLVAKTDKKNGIHTRIIWSCDWSFDSKVFATSSREGRVVVWRKGSTTTTGSLSGWEMYLSTELKNESVTAVAFSKGFYQDTEGEYLLAAGLESGKIVLFKCGKTFEQLYVIDNENGHHLTVKRLQWRPCNNVLQLASCGEDGFVKIHDVKL